MVHKLNSLLETMLKCCQTDPSFFFNHTHFYKWTSGAGECQECDRINMISIIMYFT